MQPYDSGRDPDDWDDQFDLSDLSDFPDPWEGDHNTEYWVWDGVRLVPATPEERALIQEDERTQAARRRLRQMEERERREARSVTHRLSTAKVWWRSRASVAMQWLRSTRHLRHDPHTKGEPSERAPATGDKTNDSQQERDSQAPR